jgi:cation diffusion facilitator CzcD-associated flavoprotein CzcO
MADDIIPIDAETAAAAQQKYAKERTKRLRPDGLSQYIDLATSDKFQKFQEDPWLDPHPPNSIPPLKNGDHSRFLIIGAGFGGLLFAVRLIEAGITASDIRMVDTAGGFGGTWYWNRYPGLMCDVESYIYMPLLEEMEYMPKHKYAYGPELRGYAESIAERYQLRDKAMFRTKVDSLEWDEGGTEWVVKMAQKSTAKGEAQLTIRAHFVITATGVLSHPKISDIPGLEKFQGHSFHTSRWDYTFTGGFPSKPSLVNLKDKRVGVIGTGATAVQAIPHLAEWSKELYVFQRTPSAVDRRGNHPTDPDWWAREIQGKKGWQRQRHENFNAHISNVTPKPAVDLVSDQWSKAPSYSGLVGGPYNVTPETIPEYVAALHALDLPRQEMIRARVDEVVTDRATAEKLKAWYPSWCKRPCFHDEYLQSFNRGNVYLVDTNGKGVDQINERGISVADKMYELDVIIFSTGFRSPAVGSPAGRANMAVIGRKGRSLEQKWAEGVGTLHGVISRGFPNFFFPGPSQAAATANQLFTLDQLATHVAYIVTASAGKSGSAMQEKADTKYTFTIEPSAKAEEEWSMQIMYQAGTFATMAGCTPGYLNLEGELDRRSGMEEQMKAARASIWGKGIADYVAVIEGWRRQGDLRGLEVTAGP